MYLKIMLEFANIAISLFALIYGVFFLIYTTKHRHKLPWVYLTMATVLFFAFQSLFLLESFGISSSKLVTIRLIIGTGFASMVLLSFVYQMDIILRSSYVFIQRKDAPIPVVIKEVEAKNSDLGTKKKKSKLPASPKKYTSKKKGSKSKKRKTSPKSSKKSKK